MHGRRALLVAATGIAILLGLAAGSASAAVPTGDVAKGRPGTENGVPGGAPAPTLLFTQDAEAGTLVKSRSRKGEYTLTLTNAKPRTLWFENRPGDAKGTLANQRVVDSFFAVKGEAPPNAALDAFDPVRRDDVVMGVKILGGSWNAKTRTLRYRVVRLREDSAGRRTSAVDGTVPRRFENASLFIDDVSRASLSTPPSCQGLQFDPIECTGESVEAFFGDRNTCSILIVNNTGYPLVWLSDDSWSTDTWKENPPRTIRYHPDGFASRGEGWTTGGPWLKGCWNTVTYGVRHPNGTDISTVNVGLENPYRGSNDWNCWTSNPAFTCNGPTGTLYGKHPVIVYCIASQTPWDKDACRR